jgi:hypothetical protein
MKRASKCLGLGLVLVIMLLGWASKTGAQTPNTLRVLFIGNSLIYTNDLPAIVQALAEVSKQRRLVCGSIAFPNYSLEDHWNRGEAQKAIAIGKWDVVVLQQGPSSQSEGRQSLLEYTRRFDKIICEAGAKLALYMVWPAAARFGDFAGVIDSYKSAALDVQAILFPVGAGWLEAWKSDKTLELYRTDLFHPSQTGSYLAALVIYGKLFAKSSVGLPANLKLHSNTLDRIVVEKRAAEILQRAADAANRRF